MYREVSVIEVRELLRVWMAGAGLRRAAILVQHLGETALEGIVGDVEAGGDQDAPHDGLPAESAGERHCQQLCLVAHFRQDDKSE